VLDRSDALPGSSALTSSSKGAMVWIALTDNTSVAKEADEVDEDEGGAGRGKGAAKKNR